MIVIIFLLGVIVGLLIGLFIKDIDEKE